MFNPHIYLWQQSHANPLTLPKDETKELLVLLGTSIIKHMGKHMGKHIVNILKLCNFLILINFKSSLANLHNNFPLHPNPIKILNLVFLDSLKKMQFVGV